MMNPDTDEPAAPWSPEGVVHRIGTLEQVLVRHEGRMTTIEGKLTTHTADLLLLTETNKAIHETLKQIQETMLVMNELIENYQRAKGFLSVSGAFGRAIIFIGKLIVGFGICYGAFRLGKLP